MRQYIKIPTNTPSGPCFILKLKKKLKMEEPEEYYTYLVNGEEKFTSNYELAFKRADEESEIKVTRKKLY